MGWLNPEAKVLTTPAGVSSLTELAFELASTIWLTARVGHIAPSMAATVCRTDVGGNPSRHRPAGGVEYDRQTAKEKESPGEARGQERTESWSQSIVPAAGMVGP